MKTIHKYTLTPFILMPKGAEILHIAHQEGLLTIWALVNPEKEEEERKFRIAGTGWNIFDNEKHLSTYQDGELVWHVFEVLD